MQSNETSSPAPYIANDIIKKFTAYFSQPNAFPTKDLINAGFLKSVAEHMNTYQQYESFSVEQIQNNLRDEPNYFNKVIAFLRENNAYKPILQSFLEAKFRQTLTNLYLLDDNQALESTAGNTKTAKELRTQFSNVLNTNVDNEFGSPVALTREHNVAGHSLTIALTSLCVYQNSIDSIAKAKTQTISKEMPTKKNVQPSHLKNFDSNKLHEAIKADYNVSISQKNHSYTNVKNLTEVDVEKNANLKNLIDKVFFQQLKIFYKEQSTSTVRENNNKNRGDIRDYKEKFEQKNWFKKKLSERNKNKFSASKAYTPLIDLLKDSIIENRSNPENAYNSFLGKVAEKITDKTVDEKTKKNITNAVKNNPELIGLLESNDKLQETNAGKEILKKTTKQQGKNR